MVRVGIAMTLGLVAAVVTGAARDEWHYSPAVGWIVAASVYLGATWFVVAPLNGTETEDHVKQRHQDAEEARAKPAEKRIRMPRWRSRLI